MPIMSPAITITALNKPICRLRPVCAMATTISRNGQDRQIVLSFSAPPSRQLPFNRLIALASREWFYFNCEPETSPFRQ
jgi:hypothetical protein